MAASVTESAAAPRQSVWLGRLAWLLVALTFVLVVAGGNVTTKDAGLAVPDWPLSFHSVNPEGWTRMPLVRDEHFHRLVGATVGLGVVVLAVGLWVGERRAWVRGLGGVVLLAVVAQGIMGGLRVTEKSVALAVVHGCFGQVFLCLMVALATLLSCASSAGRVRAVCPTIAEARRWTAVLAAVTFVQVCLGVVLRHTGAGLALHILGAVVVGGVLLQAARHIIPGASTARGLTRPVGVLFVFYAIEVFLGLTVFVVLYPDLRQAPTDYVQMTVPTIHMGVGAAILAASCHIAVRARMLPATVAESCESRPDIEASR